MRTERGAAEGTIEGYVSGVRRFLNERFGAGGVDLAALAASDVSAYLLGRASTLTEIEQLDEGDATGEDICRAPLL